MRSLIASVTILLLQVPTARIDVPLRQVVATVRDAEGRLVKDLKKDDFVLLENGAPQAIAHFSQDTDVPVSLGILVDTSASMSAFPGLLKVRAAWGSVRVLLRLMKPGDEFQMMSFAESFRTWEPFTEDTARIEAAVQAIQRKRVGRNTSFFESVERAMQEMKKAKYRKRALVLFTDARPDVGDSDRFARILRRSEIPLFMFVLQSTTPFVFNPPPAVKLADDHPEPTTAADQRLLEILESETGGRIFMLDLSSPGIVEKVIESIEDIAADLRGQYTISYVPNSAPPQLGRLIVKTVSPAYHVRVRGN
jgi:VWFA-related protein